MNNKIIRINNILLNKKKNITLIKLQDMYKFDEVNGLSRGFNYRIKNRIIQSNIDAYVRKIFYNQIFFSTVLNRAEFSLVSFLRTIVNLFSIYVSYKDFRIFTLIILPVVYILGKPKHLILVRNPSLRQGNSFHKLSELTFIYLTFIYFHFIQEDNWHVL